MDNVLAFTPQLDDAYKVTALTAEWVPRAWPQVEGYIAMALRRGGLERLYAPCDVLAELLNNRHSHCLWIISRGIGPGLKIDAAIITRRIDYPRASTIYVSLIGGHNLKGWWDLAENTISAWAQTLPANPGTAGIIALEGGARRGWARKPGWKITGCTMKRDLP